MKTKYIKYYFLIIALLIGFAITIQLKSNFASEGIVTIQRLLDMEADIANIESENKIINESIKELVNKVREYEKSIKGKGNIYGTMEEELKRMRLLSDLEKVEGPGIIIKLSDSTKAVGENEDLNLFLIHDIDILEIVNELRAAGAEAISINDERVTATTNIRCGGPTINIDGKRHTTPFIVKAIGDPKKLEASVLAPDSYIDILENYGIEVNVQKAEKLVIERYVGRYKLNYQKKAEDGDKK